VRPLVDFIISNKEWLFSGIGVAILLGTAAILHRWLLIRRQAGARLSRRALKKLYNEFQLGAKTASVNIQMIEEITRGPSKLARSYLSEIVRNTRIYSTAEREAAGIALQDMAERKQTRNLNAQVAERNPNKMLGLILDPAAARASILSASVFWERPTSSVHKQAFQALLDDLKEGSSSGSDPRG